MRFSSQVACCCALILILPTAIIWAQTGRKDEIRLYVESGIHHSARSLAFSSDGHLLAASGLDRTIKIWDVSSGRELITLPNNSMASFLASFPSQPTLAAANEDSEINIWNVNNQELTTSLQCSVRASAMAITEKGTNLVCADEANGLIHRWDTRSFTEMEPSHLGTKVALTAWRLSADGLLIAGFGRQSSFH